MRFHERLQGHGRGRMLGVELGQDLRRRQPRDGIGKRLAVGIQSLVLDFGEQVSEQHLR